MSAGHADSTILVVEDEEPLRMVITRSLERAGYHVVAAESGEQAVQLWNKSGHLIDMLVTDIALGGGMNGDEVARACRESRPDLPVIFASGNLPEANAEHFDLVAHAAYLMKPFSPMKLVEAVWEALAATV